MYAVKERGKKKWEINPNESVIIHQSPYINKTILWSTHYEFAMQMYFKKKTKQ